MTNIELKLNKAELTEYFILLSNFFETLNYQLGESKSDEFKNIEFKFIPENCNTEFKLPIKIDNHNINSSDYGYAFKEHENKIYLVTLFGSFVSSSTELKIEDFTNFVAKKLETTFKKSSDFYYSSISLSGENEEIDLSNYLLNYTIEPEDSDILFEQFKNFSSKKEMSGEVIINFHRWHNDIINDVVSIDGNNQQYENSTNSNLTISNENNPNYHNDSTDEPLFPLQAQNPAEINNIQDSATKYISWLPSLSNVYIYTKSSISDFYSSYSTTILVASYSLISATGLLTLAFKLVKPASAYPEIFQDNKAVFVLKNKISVTPEESSSLHDTYIHEISSLAGDFNDYSPLTAEEISANQINDKINYSLKDTDDQLINFEIYDSANKTELLHFFALSTDKIDNLYENEAFQASNKVLCNEIYGYYQLTPKNVDPEIIVNTEASCEQHFLSVNGLCSELKIDSN